MLGLVRALPARPGIVSAIVAAIGAADIEVD
jgi:hypothetical protein